MAANPRRIEDDSDQEARVCLASDVLQSEPWSLFFAARHTRPIYSASRPKASHTPLSWIVLVTKRRD